ncbi:MAG: MotA/TolQ/ExbB proton channel family protein [Nitrospirota bacterium]|nr:MotA/TolQ/ExbB proton channel family protein [Nitrospirota bacterium]
MNDSVLQMVLASAWPTKLVLATLVGFSVATWAVIFSKWRAFKALGSADRDFLSAYQGVRSLNALAASSRVNPERGLGYVFTDGMAKVRRHQGAFTNDWLSSLERRLRGAIREEVTTQEQYLGLLATTANVAPFIGLLGTVWGIIMAFREIAAQGSASIAAVAPGVAEALVATAAGLFAAIPAVVAYNYFINNVRGRASQMEAFAVEMVDVLHEFGPDGQSGGSNG